MYSERVHSLEIAWGDDISADALNLIYQQRLDLCLTPKLASLTLRNRNMSALTHAFMHEKLATLHVAVPLSQSEAEALLDDIKLRIGMDSILDQQRHFSRIY